MHGVVAGRAFQVVKNLVTEALPPLPVRLMVTEKVLLLPFGVLIAAEVAVVPVTLALFPVAVTEVVEALAVVKLIVMLVSPPDKVTEHVQALGRLSRLMTDANFREKTYAARSAAELYDLFHKAERAG